MEELTSYEKMIEGIAQFAALIGAYYAALRENGFTHEDAMRLTVEYQKGILLGMAKPNDNSRGQDGA